MKKAELIEMVAEAFDYSQRTAKTDNPLERWTRFMNKLDAIGRRRIGDQLEAAGRNRFTGEIEERREDHANDH